MRKSVIYSIGLTVLAVMSNACNNRAPERMRLENQQNEVFEKSGTAKPGFGAVYLISTNDPNKCSVFKISSKDTNRTSLPSEVPTHNLSLEIRESAIFVKLVLVNETEIKFKIPELAYNEITSRKFSVDAKRGFNIFIQRRSDAKTSTTLRICVKSELAEEQLPDMFKCSSGADIEFDRLTGKPIEQNFWALKEFKYDIFSSPNEELIKWNSLRCVD